MGHSISERSSEIWIFAYDHFTSVTSRKIRRVICAERAERKDRDAVGGGALTALTPMSPAWREISACELYMIYFSSEERQGGGAYIGASLKLGPSHDSSEKKLETVLSKTGGYRWPAEKILRWSGDRTREIHFSGPGVEESETVTG
ncbi:hypothetical protein AVEN_222201-1 [Araneus ventricosus]|uniref:Uncharacterized protein n=1 Tax=Araneus ventricosus TaxID=182803 RepID=A0A4Y2SNV6_ARAVE|nr:hypothetical protein AVEN_222201-1 [Araneus ventricosus]